MATQADSDLPRKYPPKALPSSPYIGLFGNHHNDWRQWVTRILTCRGVAEDQIYDSTDSGWSEINDENGDELQWWIDELVTRQHKAMNQACCIVFSLDSRTRSWGLDPSGLAVPQPEDEVEGKIFAARCELGWLGGIGKKTFVWVPDDLQGRNYLRAVINLYNCLVPCRDLGEAAAAASRFTIEYVDKTELLEE